MHTNMSRLTVKRAIVVVFKHWRLISSVVILATSITMVLMYFTANQYRSSIRIAINPEAMRNVSLLRKEQTVSNASLRELVNTEMGMLLSGRVIEEAWKRIRPEVVTQLDPSMLGFKVDELRQRISSSPLRNAQLSDVEFTHSDPIFIAELLNELVPTRISQLAKEQKSRAKQEYERMRRELTATVDSLDNLIANLKITEQQFNPERQVESLINQRSNNELQLVDLEQKKLRLSLAVDNLRKIIDDHDRIVEISVGDDDVVLGNLRSRYRELERKLAEKRFTFTEEHQQVQQIKVELVVLQAQLQDELQRLLTIKENQLAEVAEEVTYRLSMNGTYDAKLANFPMTQHKLAKLTLERDNKKSVLDVLQSQQSENEIAYLRVQSSNFLEVISPAAVPTKPVEPRKVLNTIVAFILSFVVMILLAFFTESTNSMVDSPDELSELLGEDVLASVLDTNSFRK